ncbi:MAG TPA: histidine phosphatase family protein [Bacillota bacterium]|nr:histidine phosphatase family protein [Bacillota bacterium]
MTKIGFVRHGVTAWNKERRAQGISDVPLDEEGFAEAERVGERLRTDDWDIIFTSDLMRARQTAEAIAERMGMARVHPDFRLRERSFGEVEGTTEEERIAEWGENWYERDLGIEAYEDVVARGMDFLHDVITAHSEKNILVVSHGAFIKYLLMELVTHAPVEESLDNTSITCLVKSANGWELELYNCTKHLIES